MKTYKIYTPWDTVIAEGKNELDAKRNAVQQLLYEIETHGADALDAEEIESDYAGL